MIEQDDPVVQHVLASNIPGSPPWPRPTLRHVRRLTDDCGIIQHAKYWCPEYHTGYCVDDNSRAMLAAAHYYRLFGDDSVHELILRYLAFIRYVQRRDGQVVNFVDYSRQFLEAIGSQDSHGRTLWALGALTAYPEEHLRAPSLERFQRLLPHVTPDIAPHALAYALLGLCAYGAADEFRADAIHHAHPLAAALLAHYARERTTDWNWFKPELTYGNARLPQALLCAAELLGDDTCREVGLCSLDFLRRETLHDGVLSVIGNKGWYPRGEARAVYDQQPIDAGAMVEACLQAYHLTRETAYFDDAVCAMGWFYGLNIGGVALYHPRSGGCCDGLCRHGINPNQGAESTLAHLLAQLALYAEAPYLFAELPLLS